MILNLKATNKNGLSILFDSSLRVTGGLDLSGLPATVNSTQTSNAGSRYQNTRLNDRNIILEFQIRRKFQNEVTMDEQRRLLYNVFSPEEGPVRFEFNTSNGDEYYLDTYPTSTPLIPPDKENNNDAFQLVMIEAVCTDPYIYSKSSSLVEISSILGGFIFPLEIPQGEGIELGVRTDDLFANVFNGSSNSVGMKVIFKANGGVVNPQISSASTFETIKLNFEMLTGDMIEIETTRGSRALTLIRDGLRTNVFSSLDFTVSTFFQLLPGDNILRYEAANGIDNLEVSIEYRNRFVGV